MKVKKKKHEGAGVVPHYERSTQGPFTGVPGWAKRAAGVKIDGDHAKPGAWVQDLLDRENDELPKPKAAKKKR